MSNQNLEELVSALSVKVAQQVQQIVELQKQLADMQKATSCDLNILSTRITAVESFSR